MPHGRIATLTTLDAEHWPQFDLPDEVAKHMLA